MRRALLLSSQDEDALLSAASKAARTSADEIPTGFIKKGEAVDLPELSDSDSEAEKGTSGKINPDRVKLEVKPQSPLENGKKEREGESNDESRALDATTTKEGSDKQGAETGESETKSEAGRATEDSKSTKDGRSDADSSSEADLEANLALRAVMPGVGVMLSQKKFGLPSVLHIMIRRLHVVPKTAIFFTVETVKVPYVSAEQRLKVVNYGNKIYRVVVRRGYAEKKCDVLADLEEAHALGLPRVKAGNMTVFLNSEKIHPHFDSWKDIRGLLRYVPMQIYKLLKNLFHGSVPSTKLPEGMCVELSIGVSL